MSTDDFTAALASLVAEAKDAGLTDEQLVDLLEEQIEAITSADP